jgi:hypothetical protein
MARLDLTQLQVETFTTAGLPDPQVQGSTLWESTNYCCDTRFDCSSKCRVPTNVCEAC